MESRVFEELTRKVEDREQVDAALLTPKATSSPTIDTSKKWSYRKCPVCSAMMQRRNYARRSGVIIDVCREHGIWFDDNQLQQILAWIKQGGMAFARRRAKEEDREAETRRRIAAAGAPVGSSDYDDGRWFTWQTSHGTGGTILIDALIDSIFSP